MPWRILRGTKEIKVLTIYNVTLACHDDRDDPRTTIHRNVFGRCSPIGSMAMNINSILPIWWLGYPRTQEYTSLKKHHTIGGCVSHIVFVALSCSPPKKIWDDHAISSGWTTIIHQPEKWLKLQNHLWMIPLNYSSRIIPVTSRFEVIQV